MFQQQRASIHCAQTYFRSGITYYYYNKCTTILLKEYAVLSKWIGCCQTKMQKSAFTYSCVNSAREYNNEMKYVIIRGWKFISYSVRLHNRNGFDMHVSCVVRCSACTLHHKAVAADEYRLFDSLTRLNRIRMGSGCNGFVWLRGCAMCVRRIYRLHTRIFPRVTPSPTWHAQREQ